MTIFRIMLKTIGVLLFGGAIISGVQSMLIYPNHLIPYIDQIGIILMLLIAGVSLGMGDYIE